MIFIGIDVAKDKHNCFIINSDGEVLFNAFAISNNKARFDELYQKIKSCSADLNNIKLLNKASNGKFGKEEAVVIKTQPRTL